MLQWRKRSRRDIFNMAHQSELIEKNIEEYLYEHENKEICRFITCGSVDDGKSTLIGRLLYDSKMIFEDHLNAIERDSKKHGTTGDKIDLALLVDGLASEREQGITIDVAYRFFSTDRRKFIIADTPGHEQYTRNMVTGASTADMAIILIDARKGVLTQTKRHSYITSLLGIKNIVVAINKMDLVDFSRDRFEEIQQEYQDQVIQHLPNSETISFRYIPISALDGDNIVSNSSRCNWYKEEPLMELLDTLSIHKEQSESFRFPIQYVNRPHLNFRGFSGTIASGSISVGDKITVLPSKKSSTIKSIVSNEIKELRPKSRDEEVESIETAFASMTTTVTLEDEIDISRGDMIVKSEDTPQLSSTLSVVVVWMSETAMRLNKNYIIKRATSIINGSFLSIEHKKEINTFKEVQTDKLQLNDIAKCSLSLDRAIAVDTYNHNRSTGSFIIIDRYTNETIGAGMILSSIESESESEKHYSQAEVELNAYIRKHYPEWDCKEIF
jgi:sulfate adenylyltransferase subunit 1